ncbi:uncharacterized protein [Ptychodera flava]|uniref:uncharacterized protein n=1 Tax=Ptychodera flava TaxID=63121 RepID=UPI00396A5A20
MMFQAKFNLFIWCVSMITPILSAPSKQQQDAAMANAQWGDFEPLEDLQKHRGNEYNLHMAFPDGNADHQDEPMDVMMAPDSFKPEAEKPGLVDGDVDTKELKEILDVLIEAQNSNDGGGGGDVGQQSVKDGKFGDQAHKIWPPLPLQVGQVYNEHQGKVNLN